MHPYLNTKTLLSSLVIRIIKNFDQIKNEWKKFVNLLTEYTIFQSFGEQTWSFPRQIPNAGVLWRCDTEFA